jgi:hypothetical protein
MDDGRTGEFIAKTEERKNNIYNPVFHKKINLRGCIYDSISPTTFAFWEEYIYPYDRQQFKQIEELLRKDGMYDDADDFYYKWKCLDSKKMIKKKSFRKFIDQLYRYTIGYGVKIQYLILPIILTLLLGTYIFHLEGAVQPKPDIQPPPIMSWCEAFWISLKFFLPVEIPSGADWNVSSEIIPLIGKIGIKFTTFATLLKIAGLSYISLAVAGYSGLLKRWGLRLGGD